MAKKEERKQLQELARMYYDQGMTLKDIANKLNVSRTTITKWMNDGNWAEKRAAKNISRPELVNKLLLALNNIIEDFTTSDDTDKKLDADKLIKVAAAIEKIDKKANVVDCIEVCMAFGKWMQHRATFDDNITPQLLKAINEYQDLYISEQINKK